MQRLGELGIALRHKAGKMSGGHQAQLASTLALARRPRLLLVDEPMAMLDPLVRHDFMAAVMTAVADDGVSVVLSSHVLAELERVADCLVLISRGRLQMAGEVEDLLACHRVLTGPSSQSDRYVQQWNVVHESRGACTPISSFVAIAPRPGAIGMGGAPADTEQKQIAGRQNLSPPPLGGELTRSIRGTGRVNRSRACEVHRNESADAGSLGADANRPRMPLQLYGPRRRPDPGPRLGAGTLLQRRRGRRDRARRSHRESGTGRRSQLAGRPVLAGRQEPSRSR